MWVISAQSVTLTASQSGGAEKAKGYESAKGKAPNRSQGRYLPILVWVRSANVAMIGSEIASQIIALR